MCNQCSKETTVFVISTVYRCPKCNRLWDHTETFYECTRQGCFAIFSRSESEKVGYRVDQCPVCGWPYGRIYTQKACLNCSSETVTICEEGEIVLCQECGKWFFKTIEEDKKEK